MSDPVRIGGFFSSFDTEAVIAQLTKVRQVRIDKLNVEALRADARKAAIADLVTRFSSLLSKVKALSSSTSASGKSTAVSGTGVNAAADPTAAIGSFTVDVTKLATGTSATGSAITAALDAASPLDESNFQTTPTSGAFTIGTSGGGSATIKVGAQAVNSAALLNASNFATAVTSGTFTISTSGGGPAVINVDIATQSLDDIVTAINGSGIGVTASIANDSYGRANTLVLTSTNGDITLGDGGDTSNFLSATNLSGATGTTTLTATAPMSWQMSLNDVIAEINGAGVGITASITNDSNGKANILSLSAATSITLGNATDTSNFLSATNVLASPGTTSRASTRGIARMNPSQTMSGASWQGGPPAAGAHSFTINGVTINYDTSTDSLNDVLNRISSSSAGVTATYDSVSDTIRLQQTKTGSMPITLADDGAGGDLLSKTGLLAATQTLGENAEFAINGGAAQYSDSNTVLAQPGVTLTLTALIDPGTPATVTVSQDVSSASSAIKGFVTEFNNVMTAIDTLTKADGSETDNQSGLLSGDASIRQLKSTLRGLLTGAGQNVPGNFTSMGQVGLSFGAVGSAVGTTNALTFDESKFSAALASDPVSVQSFFSALTLTPTLDPAGTGSISGISGTYTGTKAGSYAITDDGSGNLAAVFTPADGGPTTTTTASVIANGSTTSLIPGTTVSIGAALQAGNHTVTVAASSASVMKQIETFLENQAGAGGMLTLREDSYEAVSKDIQARMDNIQERIDREMDNLRRKFMLMEQAQARAQSIMASLEQAMVKLSATNN